MCEQGQTSTTLTPTDHTAEPILVLTQRRVGRKRGVSEVCVFFLMFLLTQGPSKLQGEQAEQGEEDQDTMRPHPGGVKMVNDKLST